MEYAVFSTPIDDRYFEDYAAGSVHECGSILVEEDEVLSFAKRFDPQPIHTNPKVAEQSVFGGLIASGWHTASLMMRLFVDHFLSRVASLSSPGVDELRWLKPVRPGDELSLFVTIVETKRSRSKPNRGIVRSYIEVRNQKSETVMTLRAVNLLGCRKQPQQLP
jgi:acyl dehydratase